MKKYFTISLTLLLIIFSNSTKCFSQTEESTESSPVFLTGPRLGVSIVGGSMANKLRKDYGANSIITQFGWQFEWRFFKSRGKIQPDFWL